MKQISRKSLHLALVTIFILLSAAVPGIAVLGSNAKAINYSSSNNMLIQNGQYTCTPRGDDSFYVRNTCGNGGYVTVRQGRDARKVVAMESLDEHDKQVEIVKESCYETDVELSSGGGDIYTRLYHPATDRYICFSRKGRVRTVRRDVVDQRGDLCLFIEDVIEPGSPYVTYTSAYNRRWMLGFNGQRTSANGQTRLPRPMLREDASGRLRQRRVRAGKCDYLFNTRPYEAAVPAHEARWGGLFGLADEVKELLLPGNDVGSDAPDAGIEQRRRPTATTSSRERGEHARRRNRLRGGGRKPKRQRRPHSSDAATRRWHHNRKKMISGAAAATDRKRLSSDNSAVQQKANSSRRKAAVSRPLRKRYGGSLTGASDKSGGRSRRPGKRRWRGAKSSSSSSSVAKMGKKGKKKSQTK